MTNNAMIAILTTNYRLIGVKFNLDDQIKIWNQMSRNQLLDEINETEETLIDLADHIH